MRKHARQGKKERERERERRRERERERERERNGCSATEQLLGTSKSVTLSLATPYVPAVLPTVELVIIHIRIIQEISLKSVEWSDVLLSRVFPWCMRDPPRPLVAVPLT